MGRVSLERISSYLGLLTVVLIFTTLNSGRLNFVIPSIIIGFIFIGGVFLLHRTQFIPPLNILTVTGLLFLGFQAIKFVIAAGSVLVKKDMGALSQGYAYGLMFYAFEALIIISYSRVMSNKRSVILVLKTLILCSFFLSCNSVIPLVQNGYGYKVGQEDLFFYPAFYEIPFLSSILGRWCSMNWAGDFIAFGIFSGLGLIFYDLYRWSEKKESIHWGMTLSFFFITVINVAVLLLLKSRGSLVFFGIAFAFFLLLLSIKWVSRFKGILMVGFVAFFFAAAMWLGNFREAVKEVQTLSAETQKETSRSWAVNLEGQKRALRIFQAYPLLGVGKENYPRVSEQYADLGVDSDKKGTADFSCMSHYFLLLAEEGAGALIYFLFLAGFIFYLFWKVLWTQSQFQFLAGASLLSAVFMIAGHASINDIMDRYGMATLVFLTLGVLTGLFRKDFNHSA